MVRRANIPSIANEPLVNEKGILKTAWGRYFYELWQRIGGSDLYSLGGLLYSSTSTIGNVGGGEDDLLTYTMPKNTMHNDNDILEFIAFGTYANNANNKTLNLYFDGTKIFTTGVKNPSNAAWSIICRIMRITATTQKVIVQFSGESSGSATAQANYIATTVDLTIANVIKCTATGVADNDIVQEGFIVKLFPTY